MYLMPWNTAPKSLYCNIKSNVVDVEHKSNTPEIYMSQIAIYKGCIGYEKIEHRAGSSMLENENSSSSMLEH